MSIRKIKNAIDTTTNEYIFFTGSAECTYMSDGRTVESVLNGYSEGNDFVGYPIENLVADQNNNYIINPNTYYIGNINTDNGVHILLADSTNDTIINEYVFQLSLLDTGVNDIFEISFPDNIKWENNDIPEFISGKIYIISIIDNVATYGAWNNNLIVFNIENTTYIANKNMSWYEWCNSNYNTKYFYVHDDYISIDIKGFTYFVFYNADNFVNSSDIIIENMSYELST